MAAAITIYKHNHVNHILFQKLKIILTRQKCTYYAYSKHTAIKHGKKNHYTTKKTINNAIVFLPNFSTWYFQHKKFIENETEIWYHLANFGVILADPLPKHKIAVTNFTLKGDQILVSFGVLWYCICVI